VKNERATGFTANGITIPGVTAAEMRELDRIAIEETGPNLFQMMENAGRNLAELSMELMGPALQGGERRVLVIAGIGGNGGGGICAARHLANHGFSVSLLVSRPDTLREIPAWQLRVYRGTDGTEVNPTMYRTTANPPRIIIDALLGYSVSGPPRDPEQGIIGWVNKVSAESRVPIVSLDLPSGLDATTGEIPGAVVHATTTMTLALPKQGLRGASSAGQIQLADIGIPALAYRQIGATRPFSGQYRIKLQAR